MVKCTCWIKQKYILFKISLISLPCIYQKVFNLLNHKLDHSGEILENCLWPSKAQLCLSKSYSLFSYFCWVFLGITRGALTFFWVFKKLYYWGICISFIGVKTNYHKLCGIKQQQFTPHSCRGTNSEIKVLSRLVPSRGSDGESIHAF